MSSASFDPANLNLSHEPMVRESSSSSSSSSSSVELSPEREMASPSKISHLSALRVIDEEN